MLTTAWVKSPPTVTLPMLVSLVLSPFFLAGALFLTFRRRRLLIERAGAQTAERPRSAKEHQ
ncbi:hypothetical protein FNH09_03885 [Streptomyces adustus]|uniref:Uncharacterized protein n=1 Tax=Streptomyces adustus TaxID=1609272 RepID=A0A5N8V5V9_9ACTN|nr:hypothetical protein [Streptomyces adustus]